jgi:hypothetical protein
LGRVHQLEQAYEGHAAFLFIHVADAGHELPELLALYRDAGLDAHSAADRPRRLARAMQHYGLTFPCLEDRDGEVRRAYGAWPERLVIVDRDGRIAFDAGRGLTIAPGIGPGDLDPSLPPTHWDFNAIDAWLRAHAAEKADADLTRPVSRETALDGD